MSLSLYFALVAAAVLGLAGIAIFTSRGATSARGLELLLVAAVLLPIELGDGNTNASVVLTAFLCATWLVRMILVSSRVALDGSRVVIATLFFLGVAILAFIVGQYPWFPVERAPMRAQIGGLAMFLLSGGLFLFVGHQVRSIRQLQWLTWLFVGTGAVQVMMMIFPRDISLAGLAVTNVGTVGSLFYVWLVAITFSQAFCNHDLSRRTRLALFAVGLMPIAWATLLASSWSSGWLPLVPVLGTVFLIRFPRFTVGLGLLLATPALATGASSWDSIMTNESYSWMTRVEAWGIMFRVIARNPWLGFGPANYHFYTPLFPLLGFNAHFNSHNNYIDLLAQTGIIGLMAFCWFCVEVFRLARALQRRAADGFVRAYAVGAFAGLAGSLVAGVLSDWIIPFTYNIGLKGFRSSLLFWLFLGGLLAIKRMQTQTLAEPRVGAPRPPSSVRGIRD